MKKNILLGTLVFILSMFMVACGNDDNDNGSAATPTIPGIGLTDNGQLSNNCFNDRCIFSAVTNVSNGEAFEDIRGGEIFVLPNSNNNSNLIQGDPDDNIFQQIGGIFESGLELIADNCGINIGLGFGGDQSLGFGCNGGIGNGDSRIILRSQLQAQVSYNSNIVTLAIAGSTTSGQTRSVTISANNDGSGNFFAPNFGLILNPIESQPNVVGGFAINDTSGRRLGTVRFTGTGSSIF